MLTTTSIMSIEHNVGRRWPFGSTKYVRQQTTSAWLGSLHVAQKVNQLLLFSFLERFFLFRFSCTTFFLSLHQKSTHNCDRDEHTHAINWYHRQWKIRNLFVCVFNVNMKKKICERIESQKTGKLSDIQTATVVRYGL